MEWDRSGDLFYGLWMHIAPGNDRRPADIRAPRALTLVLDDGAVALSPDRGAASSGASLSSLPPPGARPPTSTSTVATLERMAASRKLELDVRAADGSMVIFAPTWIPMQR